MAAHFGCSCNGSFEAAGRTRESGFILKHKPEMERELRSKGEYPIRDGSRNTLKLRH